jgi:hypothetical protein
MIKERSFCGTFYFYAAPTYSAFQAANLASSTALHLFLISLTLAKSTDTSLKIAWPSLVTLRFVSPS